jgi:regulation of enolase protein 1 (concanavalin A-like superfamily)
MVDGAARASVVVTNRGWSDWSTQPWHAPSMAIRLIRIGESIVVEMKDEVSFLPLSPVPHDHVVRLFAYCIEKCVELCPYLSY